MTSDDNMKVAGKDGMERVKEYKVRLDKNIHKQFHIINQSVSYSLINSQLFEYFFAKN